MRGEEESGESADSSEDPLFDSLLFSEESRHEDTEETELAVMRSASEVSMHVHPSERLSALWSSGASLSAPLRTRGVLPLETGTRGSEFRLVQDARNGELFAVKAVALKALHGAERHVEREVHVH